MKKNYGQAASDAKDSVVKGDLDLKANALTPKTTRTSNVTLTTTDEVFQFLDASGGTFMVTLPTTNIPGKRFRFRKDNGTTEVSFAAGATIGGTTSMKMKGIGQWIEIVSTSTNDTWDIIAHGPVVVPSGTSTTGIPDTLQFIEYIP